MDKVNIYIPQILTKCKNISLFSAIVMVFVQWIYWCFSRGGGGVARSTESFTSSCVGARAGPECREGTHTNARELCTRREHSPSLSEATQRGPGVNNDHL